MTTEEMRESIQECDKEKPFVFVSYKRSDQDKVYPFVLKLQELGVNLWIDKEMDSSVGDSWQKPAFETLEDVNCVAVVYFVSEASLSSAPVLAELMYSQTPDNMKNRLIDENFKIMPVDIDEIFATHEGDSRHESVSELVKSLKKKFARQKTDQKRLGEMFSLEQFGWENEKRKVFLNRMKSNLDIAWKIVEEAKIDDSRTILAETPEQIYLTYLKLLSSNGKDLELTEREISEIDEIISKRNVKKENQAASNTGDGASPFARTAGKEEGVSGFVPQSVKPPVSPTSAELAGWQTFAEPPVTQAPVTPAEWQTFAKPPVSPASAEPAEWQTFSEPSVSPTSAVPAAPVLWTYTTTKGANAGILWDGQSKYCTVKKGSMVAKEAPGFVYLTSAKKMKDGLIACGYLSGNRFVKDFECDKISTLLNVLCGGSVSMPAEIRVGHLKENPAAAHSFGQTAGGTHGYDRGNMRQGPEQESARQGNGQRGNGGFEWEAPDPAPSAPVAVWVYKTGKGADAKLLWDGQSKNCTVKKGSIAAKEAAGFAALTSAKKMKDDLIASGYLSDNRFIKDFKCDKISTLINVLCGGAVSMPGEIRAERLRMISPGNGGGTATVPIPEVRKK